ncbi:unnamed protein product [Linum tenue]|uniref:CCHC-type domain-containing protein n=1 Tax=Linum tenue TaxID=586396 RepID=A0AAV0IAW0_9ROSI|nr:unnamed protein product [Linum tenue]
MDLNNETFLVTFGNDQDYLRALTGGPWVILDHYLVVHQWSPAFRTSDKPHRRVVAWVQLPELPVHFYHREVLFALGNLIGRTVKLDYHTEKLERGKFARLAIELDMTKPLPTRIRLDGFWQQVLYENIPQICFQCGRIGHLEDNCPLSKSNQVLAITNGSGSDQLQISSESSPAEPPYGFGPWMHVTRKSRKPAKSGNVDANRGNNLPLMETAQVGKVLPKSAQKGKGDSRATSPLETKGKEDGKLANKKGSVLVSKGKSAVVEGQATDKKIQSGKPIKEWRAVGQREGIINQAQPNEASASNSDQNTLMGQGNKTTMMELEPQTVVGENNTTIHLVSVPPLATNLKENRDPNVTSNTSVRQHYRKKQANHSPAKDSNRGISLRAAKKPVHVAINKRELANKPKEAAFPVTISAIEDFIAQSQQKQSDFTSAKEGKTGDVDMVESLGDTLTNTVPANREPSSDPTANN